MAKKTSMSIFEYSPAPESTSHVQIADQYNLFIGNKWVKPSSGKYFKSISPSSEKTLSMISEGNEKDVDKAVKAARKAFGTWSKISAKERGKYLYRIARIIQEQPSWLLY